MRPNVQPADVGVAGLRCKRGARELAEGRAAVGGGGSGREDANAILLRNSSGEAEVRRDEIEELYSTGRSPMPTGFEELGSDGLCRKVVIE